MTARFVAGYVLAFTAFAAVRHDRRIVAYLLVVGLVAAALRLADRAVPFPAPFRWAAAGCGLLHLLGGLAPSPTPGAPVFYETWLVDGVLKFDQVVHFTASGVLTVIAWHVLARWLEPRTPLAVHAVVAVLVANGFGALNEVFEFLSALRFADAVVGDLANAGWDLVFNAFGSATAAVLLATLRGGDGEWLAPTPTTTPEAAAPRT